MLFKLIEFVCLTLKFCNFKDLDNTLKKRKDSPYPSKEEIDLVTACIKMLPEFVNSKEIADFVEHWQESLCKNFEDLLPKTLKSVAKSVPVIGDSFTFDNGRFDNVFALDMLCTLNKQEIELNERNQEHDEWDHSHVIVHSNSLIGAEKIFSLYRDIQNWCAEKIGNGYAVFPIIQEKIKLLSNPSEYFYSKLENIYSELQQQYKDDSQEDSQENAHQNLSGQRLMLRSRPTCRTGSEASNSVL